MELSLDPTLQGYTQRIEEPSERDMMSRAHESHTLRVAETNPQSSSVFSTVSRMVRDWSSPSVNRVNDPMRSLTILAMISQMEEGVKLAFDGNQVTYNRPMKIPGLRLNLQWVMRKLWYGASRRDIADMDEANEDFISRLQKSPSYNLSRPEIHTIFFFAIRGLEKLQGVYRNDKVQMRLLNSFIKPLRTALEGAKVFPDSDAIPSPSLQQPSASNRLKPSPQSSPTIVKQDDDRDKGYEEQGDHKESDLDDWQIVQISDNNVLDCWDDDDLKAVAVQLKAAKKTTNPKMREKCLKLIADHLDIIDEKFQQALKISDADSLSQTVTFTEPPRTTSCVRPIPRHRQSEMLRVPTVLRQQPHHRRTQSLDDLSLAVDVGSLKLETPQIGED